MVAYEKLYFQSQINNQTIYLKNNIAQLYFIQRISTLHFIFSSIPGDGSEIHRFPAFHVVRAHFLLEIMEYQRHP